MPFFPWPFWIKGRRGVGGTATAEARSRRNPRAPRRAPRAPRGGKAPRDGPEESTHHPDPCCTIICAILTVLDCAVLYMLL